ncbi:hypothetical protein GCM10007049_21370 [Echinicola pacifica]|uniref:Outer membrane protein beta-barrel family protein n=2 Tax=Echinicola pacifica TaxID=346377 RepID=A0A918UR38_9BACT|nr:hypothetical protein GCM10007049_21370 [Echinicola pacifica]
MTGKTKYKSMHTVGMALLCILIFLSLTSQAQEQTCKWIFPAPHQQEYEQVLDSLTVIQASISLADSVGLHWTYDSQSGKINIKSISKTAQILPDSLQICYQTFPINFAKPIAHRTLEEHYDSMAYFKAVQEVSDQMIDFSEEIFPSGKLNKAGSLTRGISFGNTQNVFVNSSLNLQMEGELADNLNVRASITDQNVPFQPQGNTQQVQDFDNVLIELYNDNMSLKAGDVVLRQPQSLFLKYYKNVQGLHVSTDYKVNEQWKARTEIGASIAKGKFNSVQLEVKEGVLGPYRIPGPSGEKYIIIMANSERVFLDGKLLSRGYNQDYIIDYNQGQITFTSNVVVTQYSRLRVDYEYAERNFSRSIITASHRQERDNLAFYFNYYKEQDNKNRPLFTEYSDADKVLLASVGDQLDRALIPRVDSVAFTSQRILYQKQVYTNTLGQEILYYEYSTDPQEAHFEVSFSEVGQGRGNYRRKEQLANGVVYEFVPPQNGILQGDYTLFAQLPAPNKKQMFTAGTEVKLSKYEKVYAELASSNQDLNLFSELGNEDNKGFGAKGGFISEGRSLGGKLSDYKLKGFTEMEYNSTNFQFIDRYRYIEFDRDWGLSPDQLELPQSEKLAKAGLGIEKDRDNAWNYQFQYRNREEQLQGVQQELSIRERLAGRFQTSQQVFLLNTSGLQTENTWKRYYGQIEYRSKVLVPGYRYEVDRNRETYTETDSVFYSAINYSAHRIFISSNDTLTYRFLADASWREDRRPIGGQLVDDTKAFTTNYSLQKNMGLHQLKGTFTYRRLEQLQMENAVETTVMGRLDYSGSLWDNALRTELNYAIGNGQELKREFVYLLVPTGEGTHTWRDDNGDGLQQLGEFYLAVNPEEKNYIKVFTPTDEYIQAYKSLFNFRLNAGFPSQWSAEKGLKKFLSKFSNTTVWNVEKKITAEDFWQRISPWAAGIAEEDLVSLIGLFRSSLFYNRTSPVFGMDFNFSLNENKQLLTGGFEQDRRSAWRLNTRYNAATNLSLRWLLEQGRRSTSSDFLDNRNYEIHQVGTGPEITWQLSSIFRTAVKYQYSHKQNIENIEYDERANLHELGLEMRYAKAIKTTLNAQLKFTRIDYNGLANTPVGYEMLNALTNGSNVSWMLNWVQRIGEGLQMNLAYEGRNSEGLDKVVHTGRMQVSALF